MISVIVRNDDGTWHVDWYRSSIEKILRFPIVCISRRGVSVATAATDADLATLPLAWDIADALAASPRHPPYATVARLERRHGHAFSAITA